MKRVLFLICVLSLVANTVLAQERPEMRRENRRNTETTERQIPPGHPERVDGQNPNAEKQPMTFMQSLKLRTDVGNPQFEAGHMMIKSSRFKTASLACAVVSGGIWFFNNSEDYEVAVAGTSVIFGAAAVILYASSLRYEWLAGKYLKMSASPGGLSASITFNVTLKAEKQKSPLFFCHSKINPHICDAK